TMEAEFQRKTTKHLAKGNYKLDAKDELHQRTAITMAFSLIGISACGVQVDNGAGRTSAAGQTEPTRSLVVTDPQILAGFSFARTMSSIRNSALSTGEAFAPDVFTELAVYQSWMRTFAAQVPEGCDRAEIDPNHYGLVCPRAPEAQLANIDP